MPSKAAICSLSVSCTLLAPFAAAAATSLASAVKRSLICARLGGHPGQRLRRRRLDLRLGHGALGRDRANKAARRFVEQGLERLVLRLDRAAQLGLAGVELLAPAPSRGVKDRGGVFRAVPDQGGQSFARTGQPVFQDLTAHDDGVVKAVGGVVEARNEAVAVDHDGVGKPGAAGLEPLDERIRSEAEVADDRIGRLAKPIGDQVALGADRLDGLSAARADASDHIVRKGVDGVASRGRSVGELDGDRIALDADRFDSVERARADAADDVVRGGADRISRRRRGFQQSIGDRVAMEPDRIDGLLSAGADAAHDLVGVSGDGAAARRRRLGKLIGDGVAMEPDRIDGLALRWR